MAEEPRLSSTSAVSQLFRRTIFPYADSRWGLRIISMVVLLSLWELLAQNLFLVATPSQILHTGIQLIIIDQSLFRAIVQALRLAAGGYILAVIVGVTIGFATGFSDPIRNALGPFIDALYSTPVVALIPMIIIVFGLTAFAKMFLVFLLAVFIIIVNTEAGIRETPDELLDAAEVFGAESFDLYRKVYLRSSLPYLLTGLRLGSARSVRGMVVAELFIFSEDLGKALINSGARFLIPELYTTIVALTLTGVIVIAIARGIEISRLSYRG